MFIVTRRRWADLRQEVHVYSHAAQMGRPPFRRSIFIVATSDGPTSVRRSMFFFP